MSTERSAPVWVWLAGELDPVRAGEFFHTPGRGHFHYDDAYLAAKHPPLAPDMPVRPHSLPIHDGSGIFPIFQDAGPDAWGVHLLQRRLERPIDDFEALTLCPVDGVGNLALGEMTPERRRVLAMDQFLAIVEEIKAQGQAITDIQSQVLDAVENGTSLGGTKPKLTLVIEGVQYLAKFPARGDDPWLPHVESAMLKLARQCGVDACEGTLWHLPDGRNTALLTRRFDRVSVAGVPGGAGRIGFVSAHAVLRLDKQARTRAQAEAGMRAFSTCGFNADSLRRSYVALADAMARWCGGQANHREARRELWRRIVFNALIRNTDDHARNHGLLCVNMARKHWALSPDFDLVAPPLARELPTLSLAYLHVPRGRAIPVPRLVWAASRKDLLEAAERHYGYEAGEAREHLDDAAATVRTGWRRCLAAEGVPEAEIDRYRGTFSALPGM